jgi:hypothetical protein
MKHILTTILIIISATTAFADVDKADWPKTDFSNALVSLSDVTPSGQPKNGARAIDSPEFVAAEKIDNIALSEPVITVNIGGDVRAYPIRILMWHGIVNDTVGKTPIAVTYDPLCNTAIVFDRRFDGEVLQFGNTGSLYNSNMIMYDKTSESWWQQYTGKAIAGKYAGQSLQVLPSRVEGFRFFRRPFPQARVLVPNDDSEYSYGANPYIGYDTYFPVMYKGKYNKQLPRMAYLVVVGDEAWPLEDLKQKGVIKKDDIVLAWQPFQNSALDSAEIKLGRDIGNVAAKRKTEGDLVDIPYVLTFAFVFNAFSPDGIVH